MAEFGPLGYARYGFERWSANAWTSPKTRHLRHLLGMTKHSLLLGQLGRMSVLGATIMLTKLKDITTFGF